MGNGVDVSELVNRFGPWDYAVFIAMLGVSALIGIYYACSGGKQSTTNEFLMGNRSLSMFPVSLSILASFMSAVTILGTATEMYRFGTQYMLIIFSYLIVIPSAAYLYMPVFYQLQVTSAYEYLELRFNRATRTFATLLFILQMLIYMAIVLYAPSLALSQVTGISVWTSVLSIGIVCTFYTSVGGIKAVVWTDAFQIFIMFGSIILVVIKGALDAGGMDSVLKVVAEGDRLQFFNFNFDPTDRHTVWGMIIGCNFTWLAVYGVSQAMVQRYLTLPTQRKARTAIWLNFPGLAFLLLFCSLAGLVIYAKYRYCDPVLSRKVTATDQLLPLFVMEVLGTFPGVPGIFVSGIFSGALSTVSSGVNSLATVMLEDIVKNYSSRKFSDKTATWMTKAFAVGFGILSIVLVYVASQMGNVLQAALAIFGIIGGPLLGVFTLGMFIPHANEKGAFIGLLVSLILTLWIGVGNFVNRPYVPTAPISVSGCNNLTDLLPMPTIPPDLGRSVNAFYRISYVWYSAIATVIAVTVGLAVSACTGLRKADEIDPKLLTPCYTSIVNTIVPTRFRRSFSVLTQDEYIARQNARRKIVQISLGKGITNAGFDATGDSVKTKM